MWASDSPEAQPQTVLDHTVGISKQDHLPAAQISMCGSGNRIEGVNASGLRGRAAGGRSNGSPPSPSKVSQRRAFIRFRRLNPET